MRIETFELERYQSTWENQVEFNLADSGVHPLTVRELAELTGDGELNHRLLNWRLGYPQTNGSDKLRARIAALYPDATPDNILVTCGASEANFLVCWKLLEAGQDVALMLPNYLQIQGLTRGLGARVLPFHLREDGAWAPDLDDLRRTVTDRTKLIVVCNPNNPTGTVLSADAMSEIVTVARRLGAWLLADEVYQGAERDGPITPSFWGMYERVIITGGLSKAYGLPGLRLGWIVAPAPLTASLWSYHDYTTIAAGGLSDVVARSALEPENRARIFARTRQILRDNYPLMRDWLSARSGLFQYVEPAAGAFVWVRYSPERNSTELAEELRQRQSVLVVPGDQFGMDRHLRINYGAPPEFLSTALARIDSVLGV